MKENVESPVKKMQQLNIAGKSEEAIKYANSIIQNHTSNLDFHKEIVYSLLLLGKITESINFYNKIKSNLDKDDPKLNSYLLRVFLETGNKDIKNNISGNKKGMISKWVKKFHATGQDKIYGINISDLKISLPYGVVHMNLKCTCKACDQELDQIIKLDYLVDIEKLCPHCLAKISFNYESMKDQLKKIMQTEFDKMKDIDSKVEVFYDYILDKKNTNDIPYFVNFLKQDYRFIISQLIVNKL